MRVMVVEDSRPTRAILRQFLEALGYEVVEAADGAGALAQIEQASPLAAVLVDWNMPVMDGCELVRQLRARPAYARLPIMMVTTENQLEQVANALEAGANEFLMKPFDQRALQEKLALLGLESGRKAA